MGVCWAKLKKGKHSPCITGRLTSLLRYRIACGYGRSSSNFRVALWVYGVQPQPLSQHTACEQYRVAEQQSAFSAWVLNSLPQVLQKLRNCKENSKIGWGEHCKRSAGT